MSVTGISEFVAGNILIGALHTLIAGALFLVYERVADSPRVALLAVTVYAANPGFVFFDSYFAYESFALPLAVSAVAAAVLSERMSGAPPTVCSGSPSRCALVVVIFHHVSAGRSPGCAALGVGSRLGARLGLELLEADDRDRVRDGQAVGAWLGLRGALHLELRRADLLRLADAVGRFVGGNTQHRRLFYRSTETFYEKYGSYLAVFVLAAPSPTRC